MPVDTTWQPPWNGHLIRAAAAVSTVIEHKLHRKMVHRPYLSLLVEGCMESGKDLVNGGARYNIGPGWIVVGAADCANGLAAIKKNVFEEKNITMDQLVKALDDGNSAVTQEFSQVWQ
jgi:formate C-acetyltransferase